MKHYAKRLALFTVPGMLLAGLAGSVVAPHSLAHAAAPAARQVLVRVAMRPKFGSILVNGRGLALYYWSREKPNQIKCTGQCALAWPPVLVPSGATVPMHIPGAMGTFGVVMRPDGGHQLTFNKHPLYTYQGDKTPSQILCDGVDGWHVYRLNHH